MRETAQRKHDRALQELELQFKQKEQKLDREVSARLYEEENRKLQWLKEEQLKEKKEIMEKHLP